MASRLTMSTPPPAPAPAAADDDLGGPPKSPTYTPGSDNNLSYTGYSGARPFADNYDPYHPEYTDNFTARRSPRRSRSPRRARPDRSPPHNNNNNNNNDRRPREYNNGYPNNHHGRGGGSSHRGRGRGGGPVIMGSHPPHHAGSHVAPHAGGSQHQYPVPAAPAGAANPNTLPPMPKDLAVSLLAWIPIQVWNEQGFHPPLRMGTEQAYFAQFYRA